MIPFLRRVSAQIYNRVEQYEQLTEALSRPAPVVPRPPKGQVVEKRLVWCPMDTAAAFPRRTLRPLRVVAKA